MRIQRLRHPLSHQLTEPLVRGTDAQGEHPLPHLRRTQLLPTKGNQGHPRLFPPRGQSRRRGGIQAHHQLSRKRHWRHDSQQNPHRRANEQRQPVGSHLRPRQSQPERQQGNADKDWHLPRTHRDTHQQSDRYRCLHTGL